MLCCLGSEIVSDLRGTLVPISAEGMTGHCAESTALRRALEEEFDRTAAPDLRRARSQRQAALRDLSHRDYPDFASVVRALGYSYETHRT
ncbi:MAG: hypothetical protein JWN52_7452 [Actinomycetia bacterium]|nr:hypothetical protein [Actinomycetes bacterium]